MPFSNFILDLATWGNVHQTVIVCPHMTILALEPVFCWLWCSFVCLPSAEENWETWWNCLQWSAKVPCNGCVFCLWSLNRRNLVLHLAQMNPCFCSSPTGDLLPALQLQVDPAQVTHHARRRLDPVHPLQEGFMIQSQGIGSRVTQPSCAISTWSLRGLVLSWILAVYIICLFQP